MEKLEEQISHLQRAVDEMSDQMAQQDKEIERLRRHVDMLMSREAERETEGTGGVIVGDERPPHY